jgi:hypothetical protein
MTQAALAHRAGVGRDWIVRLEGGHPRLEAQKVLDIMLLLGLILDVEQEPAATAATARKRKARKDSSTEAGGVASASPEALQARQARKARNARNVVAKKTEPEAAPPISVEDKRDPDPFESLFAKRAH